jgi:hypothetical protein
MISGECHREWSGSLRISNIEWQEFARQIRRFFGVPFTSDGDSDMQASRCHQEGFGSIGPRQ